MNLNNSQTIKAAAYCRVSTVLGQTPENQIIPIREFCKARNFLLLNEHEYIDVGISGVKERRPSLDKLLNDARKGKFKVLVIAALDRLGRNVKHLLTVVDELNALGVKLISLRENIDLLSPQGVMIMTVLSAFAQMEREIIRARIRESLAARKLLAMQTNNGWKCGRPDLVTEDLEKQILELNEQGFSARTIERKIDKKVSHSTISKVIKSKKVQS